MSRELKFRAYDKVEKEMLTILEMDWYPDRTLRYLKAIDKDGKEWYYDSPDDIIENLTIDQFTGLKDENGNDIYENDIVELDPDDNDPYKVIFNEGKFEIENSIVNYDLGEEYMDCEVISNIHEDGQLLEGDK